VYGTSVGAINGAAVVLGEFEKARDAWLNVTFEDVMRISPGMEKLLRGKSFDISLSELRGILNDFFGKGGIDVTPLRDLLKKFIPEDSCKCQFPGFHERRDPRRIVHRWGCIQQYSTENGS